MVTVVLDWDLWAEWRLLVGRGYAELTEQGAIVPPKIAELLKTRAQEVRKRIADAGFGVHDGMLAPDADGMDGALD